MDSINKSILIETPSGQCSEEVYEVCVMDVNR